MTKLRGLPAVAACAAMLVMLALCRPAAAQESNIDDWIRFSGYIWILRNTEEPAGPMNNRFAGDGRSVVLNPDKSLTLTLSRQGTRYYGGEAVLSRALGYGTYIFRVRTGLERLDPNLVLGLFSYSNRDKKGFDEVDIEFSAWGMPDLPVRGQYAVQPYSLDGHLSLFDLDPGGGMTSYSFDWGKDRIEFLSWKGYGPRPATGSPSILSAWTFAGVRDMPDPRRASICMNLYLADKPGPAGSGLTSVVIDSFQFLKK